MREPEFGIYYNVGLLILIVDLALTALFLDLDVELLFIFPYLRWGSLYLGLFRSVYLLLNVVYLAVSIFCAIASGVTVSKILPHYFISVYFS